MTQGRQGGQDSSRRSPPRGSPGAAYLLSFHSCDGPAPEAESLEAPPRPLRSMLPTCPSSRSQLTMGMATDAPTKQIILR